MNSTELLTLFRSEMGDEAQPYLWSDVELYHYIDDAQIRFCRNTDGIADARTPEVTRLNVIPGVEWYDTHKSILNIRSITRANGRTVRMLTAEQADSLGLVFDSARPGDVQYLVLGLEPHVVRTHPAPMTQYGLNAISSNAVAVGEMVIPMSSTAGITVGMGLTALGVPVGTTVTVVLPSSITLSAKVTAAMPMGAMLSFGQIVSLAVYRLPLTTITEDGDQEFEIDAQHHAALLYWAKSRAYDKQDAETFDRRKSDDFAARFDAYCIKSRQEQQRARREHGNVVYGGL